MKIHPVYFQGPIDLIVKDRSRHISTSYFFSHLVKNVKKWQASLLCTSSHSVIIITFSVIINDYKIILLVNRTRNSGLVCEMCVIHGAVCDLWSAGSYAGMHPYSTAAGRQRFGSAIGENLFYTGNAQKWPITCTLAWLYSHGNTQTITTDDNICMMCHMWFCSVWLAFNEGRKDKKQT